ncbi:PTS transporter subunit EIIC [Pelosinus fermentans]|uniref:PTS system, glucose-like IIB subunint n=1 Tax=Pelosinus fermentans JBW45 TaxID=1192197 RepID=I8U0C8_9FIRM|nr:PTS transporter subunit EIIC [Pelosinus fermentans]AJQ28874.1 PTS system, glucose-like IIB subunint [Pelosinus fermentans JBW45]
MKDIFRYLQQIGQSLMLPVSVLPAAGLLFRFGEKDLLNMPAVRDAGMAVFANLPLLFAVGVAIGFSQGQAVAALAAVIGHLIFLAVLKSVNPSIDMGVFSGIAMGLIAAVLYRQFHQMRLPHVLGFFAGKRFVPIITAVAGVVMALIIQVVWPVIQLGIDGIGHFAVNSSIGPALFAAGKRLLIPIGLHHVYYPAFLYEFGHFITPDGTLIRGDFNRYFAGDPSAGIFMASEFPIMMFGLPAAAFAIYYNAKPERRKAIAGLMISGALTSFLTGITEPIEFAFIFVAPSLFVFHVLMAGVSGLMTSWLDIHLGFTFSASFIDYLLSYKYGHNQLWIWPVGISIGALYFIVFHLAINRFQLKTPGREDVPLADHELNTSHRAYNIVKALGGADNIKALDACISRLRVSVIQRESVRKQDFPALGAVGIMEMGTNFQFIFGTQSDGLKEEISTMIGEKSVDEQLAEPYVPTFKQDVRINAPVSGRLIQEEAKSQNRYTVAIATRDDICLAPAAGRVTQVCSNPASLLMMIEPHYQLMIQVELETPALNAALQLLVSEGQEITVGQKILSLGYPNDHAESIVRINITGGKEIHITPAEEVTAGEDIIMQCVD